ncbi:uncharacterized protein LOC112509181 [Cynara cardunculus var. scolymus]|uniref:uncharacterized protein LOC112509181 n=1 Tax=Cynara cardunculus var. scolymus TaxID=59895 RepID=UPI000D62A877|nr:uncharacterized protein LOC112509181 [Cynara cardunculus var. scolymus]
MRIVDEGSANVDGPQVNFDIAKGKDNITAYKRSIVVYGRSDYSKKVEHHYGCYDPLSYPLFFPNDESGWHARIPRHGVCIDEIVNDNEIFDEDHEGGRLFQQFVVDMYIKIETTRLSFIERNQTKIRSDLYQGVVDCVNASEVQPSRIGQRVVLPASFIGGPRDMRRRFMDVMTLVQDDRKPDIFLTMTCNPKWSEILKELLPGQTAQDRPDLVARVFCAKLEDLKNQLFKDHIIGEVGVYVYVIEFQKRGLPHAHILMIMKPEHKITNPDHYDKIVCAEIPDPTKYPEMHELVIKHMMHGLCGHLRPSSPCMEGEPRKCRFRYPQQFNNKTVQTDNSYPMYRRRNNGIKVNVRGNILDNRWVVPYNPKLLMMFNCHINVEVCSSIISVNYVFKYVYKGHDKQVIHVDPDTEEVIVNEIKRFHDARYVSPPEFPNALRRLFTTILIYCEPGDVRKLWDEHYDSLSEDYRRDYENVEGVRNMVLTDIAVFLQSMGKNLDDFDLPSLNAAVNLESRGFREVQEEYSIIVQDEDLNARNSLNSDQKHAFDEIMTHVDNDCLAVFFVDGSGGTGKTFLYRALLANVRSRGFIALATVSSGAAANNMPGGRTSHSRFKIPLTLSNNSVCNIKKQSGTAQLLRVAKIIIWDETLMAKRQAVEALDRTMQDITVVRLPFGGKIMIMGGDFRQVLPVMRHGTRAQIVDSSLRMSLIWSSIKKLQLTINMRALTNPWFSDFLLRVGDGDEESVDGNFIRIPDDMAIPYTNKNESKDVLIDAIFPSLQTCETASDYIISRAILTTKNEHVDEINDQLIERFCGEEKIYYSFDEAEDDKNNLYPMEFLNSLTVSGLPPHYLRLKIACPIILLRNIDPSNGLSNGTRLICRGFQQNAIDAEIAVGQHAGKRVFLPRIPLCPSEDDMFPFKLKRKQFPVRLCFAMTINKAQGQTIPVVGVYLPESVFSHGQLYVALSRGISRDNTKVLVKPTKKFNQEGVYTSNVVYQEVLNDDCV